MPPYTNEQEKYLMNKREIISSKKVCLPVVSAIALHNGDTMKVIAGVMAPKTPIFTSKNKRDDNF